MSQRSIRWRRRGVFPDLSVAENLMLGAYTQGDRAGAVQRMGEILDLFPILAERSTQRVGTMSGGQQQMVAVGTALMQRPRLMMMERRRDHQLRDSRLPGRDHEVHG